MEAFIYLEPDESIIICSLGLEKRLEELIIYYQKPHYRTIMQFFIQVFEIKHKLPWIFFAANISF